MPRTIPLKRFTVSLDAQDYDALRSFAEALRPSLYLQYVFRLVFRGFFDQYVCSVLVLKTVKNDPR